MKTRIWMPRPCAVETHACGYTEGRTTLSDATALRHGDSRLRLQRKPHNSLRCHGLAPWKLTLAATQKAAQLFKMPRPCAVETHARGYTEGRTTLSDATALRRGDSRLRLHRKPHNSLRCHGLAPWRLTLAATEKAAQLFKMPRPCAVETHACGYKESRTTLSDATALRRGGSRSQLQRKPHNFLRCHGLAPWSFTLGAWSLTPEL
jgi:hypothetical protein